VEKLESDLQNAVRKLSDFFEDPKKRIILIKGYDDEAKLLASLKATNSAFRKCIFLVNVMSEAARFVNNAVKKRVLPSSINSNKKYPVGKMEMVFYSYATTSSVAYSGNEDTCTIVYPIQSVLDDNRYEKFVAELKRIKSRKIILITTNEHSIENWDIEKYADEIYFYSVLNDNPKLMNNIKNHGIL
jgi:predicted RNA-binding protein with PIN domain